MSERPQTVWREGNRIRRTDGTGYSDGVSDAEIRRHIADNDSAADPLFEPFALAVLAIRQLEWASFLQREREGWQTR